MQGSLARPVNRVPSVRRAREAPLERPVPPEGLPEAQPVWRVLLAQRARKVQREQQVSKAAASLVRAALSARPVSQALKGEPERQALKARRW